MKSTKPKPVIFVTERPYVQLDAEKGDTHSANGCHSSSGHSGGK